MACLWGATRLRHPTPRLIATVLLIALTLGLAVGMFGLFEGGYNHGVKLLLFFGGASPETMQRLFPPPTYEMPSDAFFETTGVLQFVAALMAARAIRAVMAQRHYGLSGGRVERWRR